MSFFTKYLPVPGEIKEGVPVQDKWGKVYSLNHYAATSEKLPLVIEMNGLKPVKLFLCSRDIQVGDTVYSTYCDNESLRWSKATTEKQAQWHEERGDVKVIGEISPDALGYVKEGDKFDKDSVDFKNIFPNNIVCTIKGPCGHFH